MSVIIKHRSTFETRRPEVMHDRSKGVDMRIWGEYLGERRVSTLLHLALAEVCGKSGVHDGSLIVQIMVQKPDPCASLGFKSNRHLDPSNSGVGSGEVRGSVVARAPFQTIGPLG